jgi:hypothetical protein
MTARLLAAGALATVALTVPIVASAAGPGNPPSRGGLIVGTAGPNRIFARGGPDTIFGLAGNDVVFANRGADRAFGGAGDDVLFGGIGPDLLRGGPGRDRLVGNEGNDLLMAAGDGSSDVLACGLGGQDLAIADPSDVVRPSCELVWLRDPEA